MLIALRDAGLWPQFEDWKRGLVDVLAEDAEQNHVTPFPLWDFSGFNSVTTEAIPPIGDTQTVMHWFWEPSHYKKETGDLILDRVLGYTSPSRSDPDDFGTLLSRSNIDATLDAIREASRVYARTHPEEVEIVDTKIRDLWGDSEGSNCGFDMENLRVGSEALRRGDTAAAEAAFARAVAIHEADRRRYAELGVPFREERFDTALQQVRAGQELERPLDNWQAYQGRGNERAARGELQAAVSDYSQAIRRGPPNTALYFLRGSTRMRIPDYAGAIEDFEAGLSLDPNNATLRGLLAQARAGLAQPVATAAVAVDPAVAAELQRQADALRAEGDLAGAIRAYGEAIRVGPPNTALHYLRGTALLAAGDPAGALADFQAGLALDPGNAALRTLLDQAQQALAAAPAGNRSATP